MTINTTQLVSLFELKYFSDCVNCVKLAYTNFYKIKKTTLYQGFWDNACADQWDCGRRF